MGELLYCHEAIASMPWYVEGIGINIYSLEELCYYIACNTWLLDRSFMSEELCVWVEKQMQAYRLSERMRTARANGRLSDYVQAILAYTGYQSEQQIREIVAAVRQMEEKSEFECNKIRADRLMEKEKYLSGIYEYRRLLESEEAKEESALLLGSIWHNLGVAYARLFLFGEARSCFERAYELCGEQESLRQCLFCCQCMEDEESFLRLANENGMDENEQKRLCGELALALGNGKAACEQTDVSDIIFQWKEAYRRNCRV